MKLRYFVVDANGQLHRAGHSRIKALWDGRCRADELGGTNARELRLVSVVCDADLLPQRAYLLRLPLEDGLFTLASFFTLYAFTRPDWVTPGELARHHTEGWPVDLLPQLAVALDVPVAMLYLATGVGGPLLVAAAKRVTPSQALRYLR